MGFNNDPFAGEVLVAPSVHSANYDPDTTGWSLNEDGTWDLGPFGEHDPRLGAALNDLIQPLGVVFPGDDEFFQWSGSNAVLWAEPLEFGATSATGWMAVAAEDDANPDGYAVAAVRGEANALGWDAILDVASYSTGAAAYGEGELYATALEDGSEGKAGLYAFTSTDTTPGVFTQDEPYFELATQADATGVWAWLELTPSTATAPPKGASNGALWQAWTSDAPDTYELRWIFPDETEAVIASSAGPPSSEDARLGAELDNLIAPTLFVPSTQWLGEPGASLFVDSGSVIYEAVSGDMMTDPYAVAALRVDEGLGTSLDLYWDDNADSYGNVYCKANLGVGGPSYLYVSQESDGSDYAEATLYARSNGADSGWSWLQLTPSTDDTEPSSGLILVTTGVDTWELRFKYPDGTVDVLATNV